MKSKIKATAILKFHWYYLHYLFLVNTNVISALDGRK